jgi:hypothetical protein
VHLRDTDLLSDLALGHVLDEAQMKDSAVALGDLVEHRRDRGAVLDRVEGRVLLTDPVTQRRRLVSVADGGGRIEGHRMVPLGGMHRFQHLLLGGLDPLGDIAHRRRVPELGRQLGGGSLDSEDPLLDVAGHVHRPAPVAEMALELAENGGDGEGREGGAALGVEAVYRLDQADARNLDQVVEWLRPSRVARREAPGERHEPVHQLFPNRRRALSGESPQQLPLIGELLTRAG